MTCCPPIDNRTNERLLPNVPVQVQVQPVPDRMDPPSSRPSNLWTFFARAHQMRRTGIPLLTVQAIGHHQAAAHKCQSPVLPSARPMSENGTVLGRTSSGCQCGSVVTALTPRQTTGEVASVANKSVWFMHSLCSNWPFTCIVVHA